MQDSNGELTENRKKQKAGHPVEWKEDIIEMPLPSLLLTLAGLIVLYLNRHPSRKKELLASDQVAK